MRLHFPSSIRVNLALVVIAGVVPVLVVILASGWKLREHEIHHAERTSMHLAEYYADMQEHKAKDIENVLSRLSKMQPVQEMDAEACDTFFQRLLNVNPRYGYFALLDTNGHTIASALPFPRRNLSDRREFIDAMSSGKFSVGEFSVGRVTGARIFPFALPVHDSEKRIVGVLLATPLLEEYTSVFQAAQFPEDSVVAMTDYQGRRLYRHPSKASCPVGAKLSGSVWAKIQSSQNNTSFSATGADGIRRVYAARRLSLEPGQTPYLNIFVGLPESEIVGHADEVTLNHVKWIFFSLACSVLFAWLVGRYGIHSRISRLVKVAQRLGSGDMSARSGLTESRGSLGKLAGAFDDMALALENDMEERRKVREALEIEVERRKALMDMSLDGIVIISEEHRIVEANQRFSEMLGYSLEEMAGLATWEYDAVMSEENIRKGFNRMRDVRSTFESIHRRKDGSTYHVEVSARGANIFGEVLIVAIARDITEKKEAEARLMESEARYRLLAEQAPVSIMTFDAMGRITFVNQRHLDLFAKGKLDRDFFLGQIVTELPGVVRAGISHKLAAILQGKTVDLEAVYFPEFTGGHSGYVDLHGAPLVHEDGGFAGGILIRDDVTSRIEMERKLLDSRNEAQAANKAKSEFLANMSHEIRTPLNGVLGMLQLLKGTSLDSEQNEYASMAIQSSRRLTELLSDILDISRIEAGKMRIQPEPFDVAELIGQMAELFQPLSKQSNVAFHWRVDPGFPEMVVGDGSRLQQVLTNLVGNAFKFTNSGSVEVEASLLPERRPGFFEVLFSVSDTGVGIPDDQLGMLFTPFTQISQGYRREYQGAGLGLSICKRLVELMGGGIVVDSTLGEGSTFYVRLTLSAPEKGQLPEPAAPGGEEKGQKPQGLRFLLVEDDLVSSFTVSRQLEKAGHTAEVVENGRQALDTLHRKDFDVILMDIQLPVMDGVQATRAIRNPDLFGPKSTVPIIAMTAYAMAGDKEKFMEAGMDGYIAKPASFKKLIALVDQVLKARADAPGGPPGA